MKGVLAFRSIFPRDMSLFVSIYRSEEDKKFTLPVVSALTGPPLLLPLPPPLAGTP